MENALKLTSLRLLVSQRKKLRPSDLLGAMHLVSRRTRKANDFSA